MATWTVITITGTGPDHIGAVPGRHTAYGHNVHTAHVTARIDWLASTLRCDHGPTIGRILAAISALSPGTARIVARHLVDEDAWVRAAVRLAPATTPLPGVPCPHCGERQLVVLTAGPVEVWTVVCATGRPCTGAGCPCGMPGAVEGVAHIWPRDAVLGAVAGVTR